MMWAAPVLVLASLAAGGGEAREPLGPDAERWCDEITRKTRGRDVPEFAAREALQDMLASSSSPRTRRCFDYRSRRHTHSFDHDVATCGGLDMSGAPQFMGMLYEDWWVYANHGRFLDRPGVYVDLAANDPLLISNTFFLDACLGWTGLCMDANERHGVHLARHRSCDVVIKCISEKKERVTFQETLTDPSGARSHVVDATKSFNTKIRERTVTMDCDTFAATVNLTHIDFLSLDVEQHEAAVLRGVDWDRVTIDIIIMEGDWATTGKMLTEERGYRRVDYLGAPNVGQSAYLRPGFKLAIEEAGGEIMKAVPPSHDI